MALVKFMTSGAGRVTRIVLGLLIIAAGLLLIQGTLGIVLAVVGLVPIAAGAFDFCLVDPIAGYPLGGQEARQKLGTR